MKEMKIDLTSELSVFDVDVDNLWACPGLREVWPTGQGAGRERWFVLVEAAHVSDDLNEVQKQLSLSCVERCLNVKS